MSKDEVMSAIVDYKNNNADYETISQIIEQFADDAYDKGREDERDDRWCDEN